jgi:hypothetical protein
VSLLSFSFVAEAVQRKKLWLMTDFLKTAFSSRSPILFFCLSMVPDETTSAPGGCLMFAQY